MGFMTGHIDGAGKLRKASPLVVAVAAVVLVLFASFIVYNGNGGQQEMDLDGDWHLIAYAEGYYEEGNIVYEEYGPKDLPDKVATFETIGDGIYSMHLDDKEYICVANNNIMMTGGIDEFTSTSVLAKIGEMIVISSFLSDEAGVASMILERQDSEDRLQAELREVAEKSYGLNEGGVYDAFIANQYTKDGVVDHLSENRSLTIYRIEPGIMFYNCSGDQTDLDFVAVRISLNDWMAISYYDLGTWLIDMVHIEDGVIYTASYDNTNGDIELWQVCYGDESKAVKVPSTLSGKRYEGTFNAYVEEDGEVLRSMDGELSIIFDLVDSSTNVMEVTLYTLEGDSYMGAMMFPNGSGYSFYMESVYDNSGETFWGYYIGTISKDLKKITLVGTADNADGTYMIFKNTFKLAE